MAMKIILNRAIEALIHVVSKDMTRPALEHIAVQPTGRKKARLVATDGVLLLTAETELKTKGTEPERLISASFLKRLLKLTTKKERGAGEPGWLEVQNIKDDFHYRLLLAEKDNKRLVERDHFTDIALKYPNAKQCWPTEGDFQPWVLGVDALKTLLDAAKELKLGTVPLFITVWVPITPDRRPAPTAGMMKIGPLGDEPDRTLHGLLMPCRGEEGDPFTPPDPFSVRKEKASS